VPLAWTGGEVAPPYAAATRKPGESTSVAGKRGRDHLWCQAQVLHRLAGGVVIGTDVD
jgi:hypothetical protein